MSLNMTQQDVTGIFESAIKFFKNFSGDIFPSFDTENWYAQCFLMHLQQFEIDENANIIPVATKAFKNALEQSTAKVVKLIDKRKTEGNAIIEKISNKELLIKRYRKEYNKQLSASGTEFGRDDWMNYNNWIVTTAFWDGFLMSQKPGFQYVPPENADGPLKKFIKPVTLPLQGMNMKAREIKLPVNGERAEDVLLVPTRSFGAYFNEQQKKKKKG